MRIPKDVHGDFLFIMFQNITYKLCSNYKYLYRKVLSIFYNSFPSPSFSHL